MWYSKNGDLSDGQMLDLIFDSLKNRTAMSCVFPDYDAQSAIITATIGSVEYIYSGDYDRGGRMYTIRWVNNGELIGYDTSSESTIVGTILDYIQDDCRVVKSETGFEIVAENQEYGVMVMTILPV